MAFTSLAPLRRANFAVAIFSYFISSVGSWMQTVALGVYLTLTTHNPEWLGLITLAGWTPALFGAPIGGIMADRIHRQTWIQVCNIIMTCTASGLAVLVLTHHLSPTYACLLAMVEGLASSASFTAWNSLMPDLVPREEVLAAVSMGSAQFNLGRVVGPALAGMALALGSVGLCFILNAVSFLVVVVSFAFVRTERRPKPEHKVRFIADTVHGAKVAWNTKGVRYALLGIAITGTFISPFISLLPAMAIQVLHSGKTGTSWLTSAQGVGAVLGAFLLPGLAKKTSRLFVLRTSAITLSLVIVLYGLAPQLATATALLFIIGATYTGTLNGLVTSIQLSAPEKERSRILGLYSVALSTFYPVAAVVQSAIAKYWGVREITVTSGLAMLGVIGLISLLRSSIWLEISGRSPSEGGLLAD